MLESLESRRLMTTTLDENGVLTIRGTEADDDVMVWQPTAPVTRVEHNGEVTEFATDAVTSIFVSVGDGDDKVVLGRRSANAKICGGAGDDTLSAGDGNDTIYGDSGDDYLFGRDGNDYLDGGNGVGDDADDLFGGDGTDTVDYSARTERVKICIGYENYDGELNERDDVHVDVEIGIAGSGNDRLVNWGPYSVTLIGNGGDDEIIGGPEADLLDGGDGIDELNGAGGFDSYFAKDGQADVVVFGTGLTQIERDPIDDVRKE
ncbi:MAG: hypothetical protein WBD40_20335 [Tepidisphaeraceae bacterium]